MNTEIVLRSDFRRARKRVLDMIRRAKIRAELADTKRIERVATALRDKVDFYHWSTENCSGENVEIIKSVLKEWGGKTGSMTEDEITRRFSRVLVAGFIQAIQRIPHERRKMTITCDSYGRRRFRYDQPTHIVYPTKSTKIRMMT